MESCSPSSWMHYWMQELTSINISLDTLDPELFKKVARRDGLEKVFEGIKAALAHPGLSLKINSVPVIKEKETSSGLQDWRRNIQSMCVLSR